MPRRRSTAGVVTTAQTSSGLFLKAHEQKKSSLVTHGPGLNLSPGNFISYDYLYEEFVDDEDSEIVANEDFTKTLPRGYKVHSGYGCCHSAKSNLNNNISRSQSVDELTHKSREKGRVQLVVSSNSFVSCTLPRPPKPARSGLNVLEKGARGVTTLPPQVSY